MKNINNSCMRELSVAEMNEINGGWIWIAVKAALVVAALIAGTQKAY